MSPHGDYALAAFAVRAVERTTLIDGRRFVPGEVVIALALGGTHSNG